ncbi:MAG: PDZ domain-containing protein [Aquiluna sp.]|nr:PDZ domain-containing protein [Aquiluna sp.]
MTFFENPKPSKTIRKSGWIGFGVLALILTGVLLIPTGFVIERPGQVFNVMGEIDGEQVISSSEVEIFASETRFDVTTVSLLGNRESTPSWVQVFRAWADPNQIVIPLDEVFPPNFSTEQFRAESSLQMEVSQQDAIAVALKNLGYEVPRVLYVNTVLEDAPASGILIAGDLVVNADGKPVADFDNFKAIIQSTQGDALEIQVIREGNLKTLSVSPKLTGEAWAIGAMIGYTYDFPFDLTLQLGDVGGPSGGLMFSLGVLDSLTPGSLGGNSHIAGTGTINSEGAVGPIGGIGLKMLGAKQAGATLFLAPEANCAEALAQIPSNLTVVSVRDLAEAIEKIDLFTSGQQMPELQCTN